MNKEKKPAHVRTIPLRGEKRSVFFFFILLSAAVSAQDKGSDCVQLVRNMYAKMDKEASGESVKYMNFTVKTTARGVSGQQQKTSVSVSTAELYVSKGQSRYISKELSVYEDGENAFTVVPKQKKVYWADSNMNINKEKRVKKLYFMQDTLFDVCTVKECKDVPALSEGYDKYVVLAIDKKSVPYFQIQELSFYINTKTGQVKKVIIEYTPENKIANVEWTFNEMDYNRRVSDISKPVSTFFIKGDQLNTTYKGYELVDNRIKK